MLHLNNPAWLPPVGCSLLVMLDGVLTRAVRTSYIERKTDNIEYKLEDGTIILDRLEWTYP